MCLVCFTVVGTIAVGAQFTPAPVTETPQPLDRSFSSTHSSYDEASRFHLSNPPEVASLRKPSSYKDSEPVDRCRIQEASQNRVNYGDNNFTQAGFPVKRLIPNSGVVKWALIPIEFSDLRGEKNFRSRVNNQMKLLSEWYSSVSGGRLKVEWVVLDKWATLPGKSKDYEIARSMNLGDAPNGPKLFRAAMDAADPMFDFTGIQTVNFLLPKGQKIILETSQGFPWDKEVREYKSKEGPISSFSIPGVFFDQPNRTYWSYWAHEFGHAIALPHIGLSRGTIPPFNPWDLMGGQDGPSRELSGWLRMLAGWLSDDQVYCKDAASIKEQSLNLTPLRSKKSGVKLAIIRLSATKAIMIESRRETKFSCKTQPGRNGVLVYLYDAKLGHGEDFLVPVTEPGRARQFTSCNTEPHPDVLLRVGDRVSIDGVSVEVTKVAGKDTVRISNRR